MVWDSTESINATIEVVSRAGKFTLATGSLLPVVANAVHMHDKDLCHRNNGLLLCIALFVVYK